MASVSLALLPRGGLPRMPALASSLDHHFHSALQNVRPSRAHLCALAVCARPAPSYSCTAKPCYTFSARRSAAGHRVRRLRAIPLQTPTEEVRAKKGAISGGGVKLPAWLAPALDPYPKPQDTHSHQSAPNIPAATQQAPVLGNGKRENPVQGTSTASTVSSTRLILHVGMATARFHARLLSLFCGLSCTACVPALAATQGVAN